MSPTMPSSSPSRSLRIDLAHPHLGRTNTAGSHGEEHPRRSPTLVRTVDPNDPSVWERQRSLDVDSAMQLFRARGNSVAGVGPFVGSPTSGGGLGAVAPGGVGGTQPIPIPMPNPHASSPSPKASMEVSPHFPFLPPGPGDFEGSEGGEHLVGGLGDGGSGIGGGGSGIGGDDGVGLGMAHHLSQAHDPALLVSLGPSGQNASMPGLPVYQAAAPNSGFHSSSFDFGLMEGFAEEEKKKLGISAVSPRASSAGGLEGSGIHSRVTSSATTPPPPPPASSTPAPDERQGDHSVVSSLPNVFVPADNTAGPETIPDSSSARLRQRKISLSNTARPRTRRQGGKMALFEGSGGAPPPSFGLPASSNAPGRYSGMISFEEPPVGGPSSRLHPPLYNQTGHERPYRFSFYSNKLSATIHARSLSELPAEGQSFEELFTGIGGLHSEEDRDDRLGGQSKSKYGESDLKPNKGNGSAMSFHHDDGLSAWWMDVLSPTDEEMKLLSKVFSIHPLTTEDIQMEETREKIELFRNYYFVCFRGFDQDPYSPTYLEPLNMYIIVFREGTLSFHFRPTPHPQNVRRRIKQLKDYINVTSDWISYALIDDITDAFGPLIQNIEYEVDSIDELVLILKEAEQSDMLRRIGTCRKKVMGLLRLMGNKADVVKGLAKRCNENWSVAPKSDIGLYLSDIQDHLITMTQNLNHYEKILSRSHSNYLAQISIEMTDANNQINDVLSKLTALGTVLIPMNLVTGLWGMNVHVPGEDNKTTYTWFVSIIGGLVGFAFLGGFLAYKLMRR